MAYELNSLPPQQLPFNKKNKEWRKRHMDWADKRTFFNYSLVRKSVIHKKINYDLVDGKIHMQDIVAVVDPSGIKSNLIPDKIQHYPIINSKLNVLRGEEYKRVFDYRVVITNPLSISEREETKKNLLLKDLQLIIQDSSMSEEDYIKSVQKLYEHYSYNWQDYREIAGNAILNHYSKEYNMPLIFNNGFMDVLSNGEEIFQCDIIGGEPTIEKLNPMKVRIFKSGYSNKVEDADMIVLEDYWSPGRIIDTFYDVLSTKDVKRIEEIPNFEASIGTDGMDNYDERNNFILSDFADGSLGGEVFFDPFSMYGNTTMGSKLYYDRAGNIRVVRAYWKSRRKIKKVTSFNIETGEQEINFYPENYVLNTSLGEVEQTLWINEAWEGTKIGKDIYVNMRPRVVQYNRLSNPSRCHFGIVGTVYNLNEGRPFSLVDMMKPYSYMYDVLHDRLNKAIAANWGKLLEVDLAQIPSGWTMDKWWYYARKAGILVKDSFKEGNKGSATGKLAGGFANNSRGVLDGETGNYIQNHINLLEYIKNEMAEVAGISKQREGQISNRETVGGVERANLQSSYITEWLFATHDDTKKRVAECFLETAKISLKGRNKKFQYILSDQSVKVLEVDGDEFAEADYGLVVDNSSNTQNLNSKLDALAQAALSSQRMSFASIMKLYSTMSIAEKQRLIEKEENKVLESQSKISQQEMEANQAKLEQDIALKEAELQLKETINIRDNETKLLMAELAASNKEESNEATSGIIDIEERRRQFDEELKLAKEKLLFEKQKHKDDISIKNKSLKSKTK